MESLASGLWTSAFSSVIVISILGNGIVIWIILGHKRMWTSTNGFLLNLSIVDLLGTVLNTAFNFVSMRDRNWPFGKIYCTVNNFCSYVCVTISVLTLVAITLERYVRTTKLAEKLFSRKLLFGFLGTGQFYSPLNPGRKRNTSYFGSC